MESALHNSCCAWSTVYPLVFALLPDRRRTTYTRLFSLLKDHVMQILNRPLSPNIIQAEIDSAAIQAATETFPQADVKGCFFPIIPRLYGESRVWTCYSLQGRSTNVSEELLAYHCFPFVVFRVHGSNPRMPPLKFYG